MGDAYGLASDGIGDKLVRKVCKWCAWLLTAWISLISFFKGKQQLQSGRQLNKENNEEQDM